MSKKIIHYIPFSAKEGNAGPEDQLEETILSRSAISAHVKDINSKPVPFEHSLRQSSQDSLSRVLKATSNSKKSPLAPATENRATSEILLKQNARLERMLFYL